MAPPSTRRMIQSAPPGGASDIGSNGSARTRRHVMSTMAERIVIDASVGIAHLRDEVGTVAVDAALLAWSGAGASLVVPAIFWIEILNALCTRHRYTAAQAAEALHQLDEILSLIHISEPTRLGMISYAVF